MAEERTCRWCDAGDEPTVLDRDGVSSSISGQPGVWAHAYEDSWWPCQRKAAEEHAEVERLRRSEDFPQIVCLCGSTRFKQAFIDANFRETMAGRLVLSIGWFSHADADVYSPTADQKVRLDQLHKHKIDLADRVLILNIGGYIGESTRDEIEYASTQGKRVDYLEAEPEYAKDTPHDADVKEPVERARN